MDLSVIQIAIVLVIALLVFGPKRLPELARQVGKGIREVRRQMSDVSEDFKHAIDEATPDEGTMDLNRRPVAVAADEPVVDDADILDGIVVSGDTPPAPPAGPGG